VGTGSGILAIAAARLGAKQVLAVESDADALENARDNLARNGVADRVELVHAVVDPTFLTAGEPRFELVLANVLSGVLLPLLPGFHRALTSGGRLILGGILEEEAEDVIAAAEVAGFAVRTEDLEEEWWAVLLQRLDR
jgi:ribosomal protein L11 methyltransferase